MKTKLLLLIVVVFTTLTNAQITKMEAYSTGTKYIFYPDACGETLPEAQGKLTFCDRVNNLGIVDKSLGLNHRGVYRMVKNYQNQDEAFVTAQGLSIKKADGTWENVPNIAIPTFNSNGENTNIAKIEEAIILPSGEVLLSASNTNVKLNIYNRNTKTITQLTTEEVGVSPKLFAYDADRNLTWILSSTGSGKDLFTYNGTEYKYVGALSGSYSSSVSSANIVYKDNYLYLGTFSGNANALFKIDVTNLSNITEYNTTDDKLPYDRVFDIKIGNGNDIWLAQASAYNGTGAIVKFNTATETYEAYKLAKESNPNVSEPFTNLAINTTTNEIWTTEGAGLVKLTFNNNQPVWERVYKTDLSNLGFSYTYEPSNVYFNNNKFYFVINDISSSSAHNNYEVLINNNGVWSGINDNTATNISYRMQRGVNSIIPDSNGNIYWMGDSDILVKRNINNDSQQIIDIDFGNSTAITKSGDFIFKGGNPSKLSKISFPNTEAVVFEKEATSASQIRTYGNEIWVYDSSRDKIEVYDNDNIIKTYNLPDSGSSFLGYMAIDAQGNAWFGYNRFSNLTITRVDRQTGDLTEFSTDQYALGNNNLRFKTSPDGGFWLSTSKGVVYFNGSEFFPFLSTDNDQLRFVKDIVVDTNGKLYVLNWDYASVTTIESPENNPIFTETQIEGASQSILSSLEQYRPDAIAIDSNGDVWTHASGNTFKIIDADTTPQFETFNLLSTYDVDFVNTVEVYPNPTSGRISIKPNTKVDQLTVYNLLGKVVKSNKGKQNITLNNLSAGMYILKIKSGSAVTSKKVLLK